MMKIKRNVILTIMILSFSFLLTTVSSAHSTGQKGLVWGGEIVGWDIDESFHNSNTELKYWFDTNDAYLNSNNRKTIVRSGAAKWSHPYEITEMSTFQSTTGTINTFSQVKNPDTGEVAIARRFKSGSPNSDGHMNVNTVSWGIQINRHTDANGLLTNVSIAHEFGHAYGLRDLYNDCNKDKLMYYNATLGTATGITAFDLNGANVITGCHSHSSSTVWNYRNARKVTGYKVYHTHSPACYGQGKCGGWRNTGGSIALCTYGSNGKCTTCNVYRNGDVNMDGSRTNADVERILGYRAGTAYFADMHFYLATLTVTDILPCKILWNY
jgi:hypothetical protein